MTSILMTLNLPDTKLDLAVPAGLTVRELLAAVTSTRENGQAIWRADGTKLHPLSTMAESGVVHGMTLTVGAEDVEPLRIGGPPTEVDPWRRTAQVVPDRLTLIERLSTVLGTAIGVTRSPGSGGTVEQIRAAWRWTDHDRRLAWMLSTARLETAVVIGVTGHRSGDIALHLAETMHRHRSDATVVIDADADRMTPSRRVAGTLDDVATLTPRRDLDAQLLADQIHRTGTGLPIVSMDPYRMPPDPATFRRLLSSASHHWRIVVVDTGAGTRANRAVQDGCHQVVLSRGEAASGRAEPHMVVATWRDGDPTPPHLDGSAFAAVELGEDDDMLTLAVVLTAAWESVGVGRGIPAAR